MFCYKLEINLLILNHTLLRLPVIIRKVNYIKSQNTNKNIITKINMFFIAKIVRKPICSDTILHYSFNYWYKSTLN